MALWKLCQRLSSWAGPHDSFELPLDHKTFLFTSFNQPDAEGSQKTTNDMYCGKISITML